MYARIHPFPFDVFFFFFISFSASMQNVHTEPFSFSRLAQNLLEPRVHLKAAFLSCFSLRNGNLKQTTKINE